MSDVNYAYANCDQCGTEVSLTIPFRPFQHMIFRKVNGAGMQEPVYGPQRNLCYPCFRNAVIAEKNRTSAGGKGKEGTRIEPSQPAPALAV